MLVEFCVWFMVLFCCVFVFVIVGLHRFVVCVVGMRWFVLVCDLLCLLFGLWCLCLFYVLCCCVA